MSCAVMEATNSPDIFVIYSKYMQSGTQWNAFCLYTTPNEVLCVPIVSHVSNSGNYGG